MDRKNSPSFEFSGKRKPEIEFTNPPATTNTKKIKLWHKIGGVIAVLAVIFILGRGSSDYSHQTTVDAHNSELELFDTKLNTVNEAHGQSLEVLEAQYTKSAKKTDKTLKNAQNDVKLANDALAKEQKSHKATKLLLLDAKSELLEFHRAELLNSKK